MKDFKNYVGLTQEEMATFLGVPRSIWSMFVIGKRSPSLEVMTKLNALLVHLKKNDVSEINVAYRATEKNVTHQKLSKRLHDLEVSLHQLKKKISKEQNIRTQLFIAMNTIDYLKKDESVDSTFVSQVEIRVEKGLLNHSEANLELLKLKKVSLEKEMMNLKKVLNGQ